MSALEETIRAIVREELAAAQGPARRTYSSEALPLGIKSREHFAAECRRLRIGAKHGRIWTVDAAEWDRARAARRRAGQPVKAAPVPDVDAQLERAGLRLVSR